jgi:hypothetical protein
MHNSRLVRGSMLRLLGRLAAILLISGAIVSLALWQYEARQRQQVVIGSQGDAGIVERFHEREQSAFHAGRSFRWFWPNLARLRLWAPSPAAGSILSLTLSVPTA